MATHWGTAPAKRPFPSLRELRAMTLAEIDQAWAAAESRAKFLRDDADAHQKFAERCGRELELRNSNER